jgi:ribosome-associated protein
MPANNTMIRVTDTIAINEMELAETFIKASGPGGQNVNKVSTAVQLRFDVRRSPSLPEAVKDRLEKLAGARLTRDGVIVIQAQRFRTLERNRKDALERLVALIARAAVAPKRRRPTRPTAAAKERRLESKTKRSLAKSRRGRPMFDD